MPADLRVLLGPWGVTAALGPGGWGVGSDSGLSGSRVKQNQRSR